MADARHRSTWVRTSWSNDISTTTSSMHVSQATSHETIRYPVDPMTYTEQSHQRIPSTQTQQRCSVSSMKSITLTDDHIRYSETISEF